MEEQGIIGPADGSRPRDVLINSADEVFNRHEEPAPVETGDVYDEIPTDDEANKDEYLTR